MAYAKCMKCQLPLRTEKSRELGYGPICLKKIEDEKKLIR